MDVEEIVDLIVAMVVFILSVYLTIAFGWFMAHLRNSHISLKYIIGTVALAKFALCFQAATWIYQIWVLNIKLQLSGLPFRMLWLVVVVIQSIVIARIRLYTVQKDISKADP